MDAIKIQEIGKKYTIVDDYGKSDFWALKDVTFDVKKGDSIGIVGKRLNLSYVFHFIQSARIFVLTFRLVHFLCFSCFLLEKRNLV